MNNKNNELSNLSKDFASLGITNKTGVIYDPEMLLHNPGKKSHPECPARLTSIINNLEETKVLAECIEIKKVIPCTEEHILSCYKESYIQYVRKLVVAPDSKELSAKKKNDNNSAFPEEEKAYFFGDTYYNIHTSRAADLAVGAMIQSLDAIYNKKIDNCFACVRPPGHHSGHNSTINGFCIYNNVAIAAKYARTKYGAKRVLIVDWDVHHGDGSQHIFFSDNSVLYCSLHRYDEGFFYPGNSGDPSKIGTGKGLGYNINVAWNLLDNDDEVVGDNEYVYCYERLLHPIFKSFDPDLVIVSAGFDSARGDPLGCLDVTVDG